MKTGRFFLTTSLAVLMYSLLAGTAFAGFGFGGDDAGNSGLDFSNGYDVNTVATLAGRGRKLPGPYRGGDPVLGKRSHGEK